jgi:two-component system response regulator AtoC
LSCPAVPEPLVESELFGYERGAFTGAYERKTGLVELAQGGTLFLDEIGELTPGLQAKLLHLLQDGTFMRVGGCEEKRVDIRVVCATNRRLQEEIELGGFRADLFYRLNVVSLEIPPLRERRQDIRGMAEYFLDRYCAEYNSRAVSISPRLMMLFEQYNWPGNVRELENLVKRYVILGSEDVIVADLLGTERIHLSASKSLKTLAREAIQDFERNIILDTLYATNWNRKEAARILKISYRALFYKLKNSGVPQKRQNDSKQKEHDRLYSVRTEALRHDG